MPFLFVYYASSDLERNAYTLDKKERWQTGKPATSELGLIQTRLPIAYSIPL